MASRKMVLMNLHVGQQWKCTHSEQIVDAVGEGEDGMSWERSTETHPLPYVKQKPHGNVPLRAGNSNPALCDNLEGWDRVGSGTGLQERGDICIPTADSC